MNPYKVLGLVKSRDVTVSEIAKAYRRLALEHHPDRNPGGAETFKKVSAAYTILSDPVKRQLYDEHGVVDDATHSADPASMQAERSAEMAMEIAAFYKAYAASSDEKEDLVRSYARAKGDFKKIIESFALFDNNLPGEVERIKAVIESMIGEGRLEPTHRWGKSTIPEVVQKLKRRMEKERMEAEAAIQEIHGAANEGKGGEDSTVKPAPSGLGSLQALILQRKQERAHEYDQMVSGIAEKYCSAGQKAGKKGKRVRDD